MNDEIMVSISCLTYRHEKYIRQCLDGFLMQQTNFKFEVLIHDDASPDHTADIIREYEKKYPEIIKPIYQTENQYSKGVKISATYQAPRARGKYVAFCEGDDFWTDPFKLQKQFDALEQHPDCHMCVHQVMRTNEEGIPKKPYSDSNVPTGVIFQKDFFEMINRDAYGTPFQTSSYFMYFEDWKNLHKEYPDFVKACMVGDLTMLLYLGNVGSVYYYQEAMSCYRNGVQTSFTHFVPKDPQKLIKLYESRENTYCLFEEYSGHQYDLSIIIGKTRSRKFQLKSDYKSAWKTVRRKANLCDSKWDYCQIFVRAYFPKLYDFQHKLRGKE